MVHPMFTWCLARAPWGKQYGKNQDLSILLFWLVVLQLFEKHFHSEFFVTCSAAEFKVTFTSFTKTTTRTQTSWDTWSSFKKQILSSTVGARQAVFKVA